MKNRKEPPKGYENHIKQLYKQSLKEIKQYCESIDQSYDESLDIMNELTAEKLDSGSKPLSYNELDRMEAFILVWQSIKNS